MQNDNSFGSRVAATWRALVEHMEYLSSAEQDEAGSPTDPFDFTDPDGWLGSGGLGGVVL